MSTAKQSIDVYQIVTDRIISLLEAGTVPWQKPWSGTGMPCNLMSKRPYRGINLWLLASLNYESPYFLTWDQLKKVNGSVKKGENGAIVMYWRSKQKDVSLEEAEAENEKEQHSRPVLRYYRVYNVEQCTGIPEELLPKEEAKILEPIPECVKIVEQMPNCPSIKHKKQQAYYHPTEDYINMPKRGTFDNIESYYATLFHELVHSTGHEKRLHRKSVTEMAEFGGETYSFEELIAEIGCCYLCNTTGIMSQQIENSAAYMQGWLGKLKGDKRFVVHAASQAQRAADYILNMESEEEAKRQVEENHAV